MTRHAFVNRTEGAGHRSIIRAVELLDDDVARTVRGHLVTVEHHEIVRSRGYLVAARESTAGDLTAAPGDVVLLLRARRGHRASAPEWKLTVEPTATVLVHQETAQGSGQPAPGGDAA